MIQACDCVSVCLALFLCALRGRLASRQSLLGVLWPCCLPAFMRAVQPSLPLPLVLVHGFPALLTDFLVVLVPQDSDPEQKKAAQSALDALLNSKKKKKGVRACLRALVVLRTRACLSNSDCHESRNCTLSLRALLHTLAAAFPHTGLIHSLSCFVVCAENGVD